MPFFPVLLIFWYGFLNRRISQLFMTEEDEKHIPEGIEYKHRTQGEKKASRVGVRGEAEGMAESGGEGGPPGPA
jgi:hypothetical protein